MLYSLSSAASVVGRSELAKIIAVIGARLESYRPHWGESNWATNYHICLL